MNKIEVTLDKTEVKDKDKIETQSRNKIKAQSRNKIEAKSGNKIEVKSLKGVKSKAKKQIRASNNIRNYLIKTSQKVPNLDAVTAREFDANEPMDNLKKKENKAEEKLL